MKNEVMIAVYNLSHLAQLAKAKRAVIVPNINSWAKPHPAAFVLHLTGYTLNKLFESGMYLYDKPQKKPIRKERNDN